MEKSVIHVKVPGKLFIAGEYAVLEPNQFAIVIAVNRYMKGTIEEDSIHTISLPQIGFPDIRFNLQDGQVLFNQEDEKLVFVKNALSIFYQLLKENGTLPRPFRLTVTSELDDDSGKKFGLGSSAAIVVTVITALLNFYKLENIRPTKEWIYKLSAIAHYQTQGNGSCADIAASTYGGWLHYQMFRPEWLNQELKKGTSLSDLLKMDWPGLHIERLTPPIEMHLAVGWTKKAASTASMVKTVQRIRNDNPPVYKRFLKESTDAVTRILESFLQKSVEGVIDGIKKNRMALQKLGEHVSFAIETKELKKLIDIANKYGGGKSSGAGGGDCGIALVKNDGLLEALTDEWKKSGIFPLSLQISEQGADPAEI